MHSMSIEKEEKSKNNSKKEAEIWKARKNILINSFANSLPYQKKIKKKFKTFINDESFLS